MSYKDLLVHLDDSTSCARRVDAAVRLAARYGAHLTGFYPIVEIPLLHYIRDHIPPDVRASMAAEAQVGAKAALEVFRQAAERSGVAYEPRTEPVLATALPSVLSMHARYADLLVLGQMGPDEPSDAGSDLPEKVVLASGRPVLVVPHDWAPGRLGERVIVAWDASREAARAVSDARPILERAESVLVVSINPKSTPLGHGQLPGVDIALHLARHEIAAEVQVFETDRMDAGDALLSIAADRGCDLLVMGAYAHPRMVQLVLGGVTRTVLEGMTLPILMAH
jgi:nucleotide-binding universal stress UspA family protein